MAFPPNFKISPPATRLLQSILSGTTALLLSSCATPIFSTPAAAPVKAEAPSPSKPSVSRTKKTVKATKPIRVRHTTTTRAAKPASLKKPTPIQLEPTEAQVQKAASTPDLEPIDPADLEPIDPTELEPKESPAPKK